MQSFCTDGCLSSPAPGPSAGRAACKSGIPCHVAAWKVTKLHTLVRHPPVHRGVTEIFIYSQISQTLKQQKDDEEEQEKADFVYVPCFSGCQSTYLSAGHTYRSFL